MNRRTPLSRSTPLRATASLARKTGLRAVTPLKTKSAPKARTTRIKPISAKRAEANRERAAAASAIHPADWLCGIWQARLTIGLPPLDGCQRRADAFHEPKTRGRGGSITDPGNRLPACNFCNGHLSSEPDSELGWAYRLGLLFHSWEAPSGGEAA